MQNVLALAPAIAKTSSFGSSAGRGRACMIDARDVGAVAAETAASPARHAGKTSWLTGPELISNYNVAAVLSRLLGRTITYRELSFDENKEAMIRAGVPETIAEMNAQAFSMTAEGDTEWITGDVPSLLGLPARSSSSSPPTSPEPGPSPGLERTEQPRRCPARAAKPAREAQVDKTFTVWSAKLGCPGR